MSEKTFLKSVFETNSLITRYNWTVESLDKKHSYIAYSPDKKLAIIYKALHPYGNTTLVSAVVVDAYNVHIILDAWHKEDETFHVLESIGYFAQEFCLNRHACDCKVPQVYALRNDFTLGELELWLMSWQRNEIAKS